MLGFLVQPNTGYYIDVFTLLFKSLNLTKFHLLGHHCGAGLATELAVLYPDNVLTVCLVRAAIMKREEQIVLNTLINVPLNEPVASGAHLQKTWDYLASHGVGEDPEFRQSEALDHISAWKVRNQIYRCVFNQDMWGFFGEVRCEAVIMCARDDVLWPHVKEIVSWCGMEEGMSADVGQKLKVRVEEVNGGDFETGRPDSAKEVAISTLISWGNADFEWD